MTSRIEVVHSVFNAARILRAHRERILSEWEGRARKELPAAIGQTHYVLMDSLPQFLDELVSSLDSQFPKSVSSKDVAESHALQRSSIKQYDLEQVLAEYTILRQIIFDVLDREADLTSRERNIILDFLQRGKVAAA